MELTHPDLACEVCAVVLTLEHDPSGRTLIRHVHAPGCPAVSPTASVAHDNA